MIKLFGSASLLLGLFLLPLNLKLFSEAMNCVHESSAAGACWIFFSILFSVNILALFAGVKVIRRV